MKTRLLNLIVFTIAFAVVQPVHTEEHATSLDVHVHGLSELTIVMEGETFEIQFTSPAMNLVGFEHKASTQKDIAAVERAESQLRQHDTLFLFSKAHCEHVRTSIDTSGLIERDHHEHIPNKKSSEHEHKDEHNHEHQNHAQDDSHNDNHSDIVANYQYRCDTKSTLSAITVNLFHPFSGIHKIHSMWVTLTQQGAVTLTPNNRIIEFR